MNANSLFNVAVRTEFPTAVRRTFGVIVQSLGGAQLAVERAQYSDAGGINWAAGSNAPAMLWP